MLLLFRHTLAADTKITESILPLGRRHRQDGGCPRSLELKMINWDNGSVSSSSRAGRGQAHLRGAQGTQHPVVTLQGHGEGGWAEGMGVSPKTWHREDRLELQLNLLHSSCHCSPSVTANQRGQFCQGSCSDTARSGCHPTSQARSDSMQGRAEKEFPAPDFPATHFMA